MCISAPLSNSQSIEQRKMALFRMSLKLHIIKVDITEE